MNKYDDIINLNRPVSKHPHLNSYSRAAQFAPFAALTGYDDEIKETARLTSNEITIDEDQKIILNNRLNYLQNHLAENIPVKITYFEKDSKKTGGKYLTKEKIIKKIDSINEKIIFNDNTQISLNNIIDIDSELFKNINE